MSTRRLSLAHLSMISVAPVELVRAASSAGFDSVGLRLAPTSHGVDHGVLGSRQALAEIRRELDASGTSVLDVEVIRVREPERMTEPGPLIEAAALLGASWIITTIEDADVSRRTDTLGRLCAEAARAGVGISLEFMVFSAVPTLTAALSLLGAVGAANAVVLVDALHHERGGSLPEDLATVPPHLLPYIQVCDARTAGPQTDTAAARAEAVTARLLPGDGALPLETLVAMAPATAALSVEAPLAWPDDTTDPAATAQRAWDSVQYLLTREPGQP